MVPGAMPQATVINGRWPMLDCQRATSKSVSEECRGLQLRPRLRSYDSGYDVAALRLN